MTPQPPPAVVATWREFVNQAHEPVRNTAIGFGRDRRNALLAIDEYIKRLEEEMKESASPVLQS